MKNLSKTQLLQAMERRVKRYVKHYQTDFYDYDVKQIDTLQEKNTNVFITRECGTYLITIPSSTFMDGINFLKCILGQYNPESLHCYFIDKKSDKYSLENVSVSSLHEWIARQEKEAA